MDSNSVMCIMIGPKYLSEIHGEISGNRHFFGISDSLIIVQPKRVFLVVVAARM